MENNETLTQIFEDFHFYETADGSPTLSFGADGEKMHHSAGAFSETLHVYGAAADEVIDRDWGVRALSLGLGLGYNEILLASRFDDVKLITSFEKVPELNRYFLNWVHGQKIPKAFQETYDKIARLFSQKFDKKVADIKWNLQKWKNEGSWIVGDEFKEPFVVNDMTLIFFDPFCSKTDSGLWDENFLQRFLTEVPAPQSVLSSYAFTGVLKRALLANKFDVLEKEGFAGKRQSTLAVKFEGNTFRWFPDLKR